ncbi:MAG: GAF domain-containing protein, partial [Solirubrobacteraceae bacterium]|nr:GAF domain-containing protein [Solirubrobacteraceae bacterium]
EAGQYELADANAALLERGRELEHAASAIRAAHGRTQLFARVADELGRIDGLQARAEVVLTCAADMLGAEIGCMYALTGDDDEAPQLVAARGVSEAQLPATAAELSGLAGRALTERRSLTGGSYDGDLRLEAFGKTIPVRRELHVPMRYGDQIIGVLSIGRSNDAPFAPDDIAAVEHLGEQGAVAFINASESERRRWLANVHRAVLDATGDAIRLIGPDGELILNNREMKRFDREVFGIEPIETGADLPAMGHLVGQQTADPEAYRARLQEILADPEREFSDEYELVTSHRWIHRFTAPVHTSEGKLAGRIFVLREVTEQRRASALKDELMSTVSHELRTPLSAILGFAELLRVRDYDKAERDEYLDTIHQQATRLSRLISDFLDIQRLEQSDEHLRMNRIELRSMLKQQVELFARQSTDHPVELRSSGDLLIDGDEEHLRRAVSNLISNAIKYSPDGGAVTVEATRKNGDVVVAVRDEGIGIPAEDQRRVFDRFFRVDSVATRKINGTGLGLALVREIARAHGGDVGVESVEGQGSRFWLKVPATQDAAAHDAEAA